MTTADAADITVSLAQVDDRERFARFAERHPLAWNDFAAMPSGRPDDPKVWAASAGDGSLLAAAIDDGLAMSVAGDARGLAAIAQGIGDLDAKLVIAGRTPEVRAFVGAVAGQRRERPEHFMVVARSELLQPFAALPLRVATMDDLPLLVTSRSSALAEEYGIDVVEGDRLYRELAASVERAVRLNGVAIWREDDRCAFTAQLISKSPTAAMFGDLYVAPELRGAGRATQALTAFCGWLMTESEHVTLRVGIDNEPALRLYARVGFHHEDDFCSSLGPLAPG